MQTLEHFKDADGTVHKVNIKEVNSFRGIPYADYFNVNTEWIVVATAPLDNTTGANSVTAPIAHSGRTVKVTIYLDFLFHKSTWLQGTIESNTKAELIGVYELWLESAQESLRRSLDRRHTTAHNLSSAHLRLATDTQAAGVDIEQGAGATADKETPQGTAGNEDGMQMNNNNNNQQVEILGGEDEDGLDEMGAVRIESGEVTPSGTACIFRLCVWYIKALPCGFMRLRSETPVILFVFRVTPSLKSITAESLKRRLRLSLRRRTAILRLRRGRPARNPQPKEPKPGELWAGPRQQRRCQCGDAEGHTVHGAVEVLPASAGAAAAVQQ